MKRLSIIGRGTAGCYALSHFTKYTNWEINLFYDENIPQQAVGEGATLDFPTTLFNNLDFRNYDLEKIDGTPKLGIYKQNWCDNSFIHDFIPPNISYHFNAVKLQDYILSRCINNPKVKIINQNIDHQNIDSDFIFDCSGKPKDKEKLIQSSFVPVNSVYVTQCFWERPTFQNTLTIARPYGWVFGIPLKNRCSVGYLYNKEFTELDDIKEDVKTIFKEWNLNPSETTNQFSFDSYRRIVNFTKNIAYSGNSSFFLEPLEATSIRTMDSIQRWAFNIWHDQKDIEEHNQAYHRLLDKIEHIIMLHYFTGSVFNNNFWKFAEQRGRDNILQALKKEYFNNILRYVIDKNDDFFKDETHGTWHYISYFTNIKNLNLEKKIKELRQND